MRTKLIGLAIACLFLPLAGLADDKDAAVKEIDIKGMKVAVPRGKVDTPTVITNAEELARAFPEAADRERIKKEADLGKQKLLLFAWAGSGQDKLAFAVEKGEKGPQVLFNYTPGLTRDLRPHSHLYVMPKDATWKMQPR